MGFQPIVPFGGLVGWTFLQRTEAAQKKAFEAAPEIQRDLAYFKENIAKVSKPQDLIDDYRLLKVSLGAFGLDGDIGNKAFIRKVLEEGTIDPASFANKMVDKRYQALSKAFGFDLGTPNTKISDFASRILPYYTERRFEIAVGEQNADLRLSMSLERELGTITGSTNTADGKWFAVMGNAPLRQVFETALGLPASLGALDLDQQLATFRARSQVVFGAGEIDHFSKPEARDELNRMFLARAQINSAVTSMSSGSIALALLQN